MDDINIITKIEYLLGQGTVTIQYTFEDGRCLVLEYPQP